MKVVFAAVPGYGHVYPLVPLATAFEAAGHDAVVATGAPFVDHLPVETVDAFNLSIDDAHEIVFERHPELRDTPPEEKFRVGLELFADVVTGEWLDRFPAVLDAHRPDLVVFEATAAGAGVVAQRAGVRSAAFGISFWSRFGGELNRAIVERHGGALDDQGVLGDVYLDPFPTRLQDDDGPRLTSRKPIRYVPWSGIAGDVPAWMQDAGSSPRVYITLGTVSHEAHDARALAIDAVRRVGGRALVALGPGGIPPAVNTGDVEFRQFVPQDLVLAAADVVVHHGGSGTMLGAAAARVPQVVLPQGADQFQNGAALQRSGAGVALMGPDVDAGDIAAAIEHVLTDGAVAAAIDDIGAEIAAMPSPDEVVAALT